MKRRTLSQILVLALLVALGVPASAWAGDLTVLFWGGPYTTSRQIAYGVPSKASTDANLHWGNNSGSLEEVHIAEFRSGVVAWDVVDLASPVNEEVQVVCNEGLFEPIPPESVVKAKNGKLFGDELMAASANPCINSMPGAWSMQFRVPRAAAAGMTKGMSIAEAFFSGKRDALRKGDPPLTIAMLADGVSLQQVSEVAEIDELLANILTRSGWSDAQQLEFMVPTLGPNFM